MSNPLRYLYYISNVLLYIGSLTLKKFMQISSQSLYRDILKRAFFITIKNRILWVFGFFASFLGLGGMYDIIIRNAWDNSSVFIRFAGKFTSFSLSGLLIAENFNKINILNLALLFLAIIASVLIFAVFTWLSINFFGGLIFASQELDKKHKIKFLKSFNTGRKNFWQLLGVNLTGKILILIILTLTGGFLTFILVNNSILKGIIYFLISILLLTFSLFISFLIIYASCLIILKSKKLKEAIFGALELFKQNWIVSIEMATILFLANLLLKLLLIVVVTIFSIPLMILLILFYNAQAAIMPPIILGIWMFMGVVLMIFIGSLFSTFQIVAWTLLFDKIFKGGVLSKLHRIFG